MPVGKKLRIILILLGGLLLLVAVGLLAVYRALQHVPEAYRRALTARRHEGQAMIRQTTALISNVKKEGQWEAEFTAEQINGWLAFELSENHPDALPDEIREPRVAIEPDRMLLFCEFNSGGFSTVLTLTIEPYVEATNVLALRIRKARAGSMPFPRGKITDGIREAARREEIQLEWRQDGGDPVALITIDPPEDAPDKIVQIERIQLVEGKIYLAGKTSPRTE